MGNKKDTRVRRRQRVRKALIIASFVLFPVTFYYLSPILIIQGASEGIIVGSFIAFALMFLFSLVLGRAFCGWVCPAGGMQELCFKLRDKRAKGGRLDWIKYFIWVPWLGAIAAAAIRTGGFNGVDPLYQTYYGISIAGIQSLFVLAIVLLVIFILAMAFGRRAFCHYGCWMAPFVVMGRKAGNVFRWPSLRLAVDEEKCIDCKKCTKVCPMSLEVNAMVKAGQMENSECILCGMCVDNCPKEVISYVFGSKKRAAVSAGGV
ncbi:MAG: 4Fe-4S binding protein [Actinobacteria bacterium]|jgi:polyferredoxin|nr:MAG: 4Fe-4S binding protein [Actinomycetota bacterium]